MGTKMMNRRFVAILLLLPAVLLVMGCGAGALYRAPFQPPQGILFSQGKAPLTVDFDSTPVATDHGEASSFYFYEPIFTRMSFAWDPCDIETAKENGNLSTVAYADYETLQILGIFGITKVRAYGLR